jgi:hypothetical protein
LQSLKEILRGECRHKPDGHHKNRPPTLGYEPTREAAMAAFAKSWRRRPRPSAWSFVNLFYNERNHPS